MSGENQTPDTTPDEEENAETDAAEADGATLQKEQLDEALREKDQFRTMAQRAQADLMNYKRRAAEEMEEVRQAAKSDLLLNVLSTVDDLERGLSLIPADAVAPGWLEGLQLVMRNIDSILDSEGISKIEAAERPFNPREFEAVQYKETPDAEEGSVIKVLREGYKQHGKVLRAAQVVVAKKPETEGQSETTEEETQ